MKIDYKIFLGIAMIIGSIVGFYLIQSMGEVYKQITSMVLFICFLGGFITFMMGCGDSLEIKETSDKATKEKK